MMKNKDLDDLYIQKQKLIKEQLELAREELNLKIELQELLNRNNGRKGTEQAHREDYRLHIS